MITKHVFILSGSYFYEKYSIVYVIPNLLMSPVLPYGHPYCHMVTRTAIWSPVLPYGHPYCHMVTRTAIWSPVLPYGHPYCHMVTRTAIWSPVLPYGHPYCHMVTRTAIWSPVLPYGHPYCHMVIRTAIKGSFIIIYKHSKVTPFQIKSSLLSKFFYQKLNPKFTKFSTFWL